VSLGALPPSILFPPPGPRSRALAERLRTSEAPGINAQPADPAAEPRIVWAEAAGTNVVDVDGNRYLDLTSGFGAAAIGHRHPAVVAAVGAQTARLLHGLGDAAAHDLRPVLAERLAALAPFPAAQVFFTVTGAEAVEVALKTALLASRRNRVLAFSPAYHGLTWGALAVTSRPEFRAPFALHLDPQVERLPFGCEIGQVTVKLRAGAFAAAIVEPIVGREGVLLPPPGWLAELGAVCRAAGTLVIADEIFTGFGRTGTIWVSSAEGLIPDLLCCGKALGGGLPIAAVLGPASLMAAWRTPGEALHTSTFAAHPLACAAALAALDVLTNEQLARQVAELGDSLAARLRRWPERFPRVTSIRARGLLGGIDLVSPQAAQALVRAAQSRGVLILAGGATGATVQLVPPLTIDRALLELALDLLEASLGDLPALVDDSHPAASSTASQLQ
jgi:4-aminobutyrate aminotransferase-like enzyme